MTRSADTRRGRLGRTISSWWTGYEVEEAWSALHAAQEALVAVQDEATLRTQLSDLEAGIDSNLASDPRTKPFKDSLAAIRRKSTITTADRETIRGIRMVVNATSDAAHRDVRSFRNAITVIGAVLGLVALGIASIAATDRHLQGVFDVQNMSSGRWMGFELLLIGALAGLTGLLLSLKKFSDFQSSYSLTLAQAFVKGAAGAAAALLGILLVQSGLINSLSTTDRLWLYGYAVLFGSSQQLVTRLADQKATTVLDAARSHNDPATTGDGTSNGG